MTFSRGKTRAILRTLIPLLAVVWASLPLHQCNVADASTDRATAAAALSPQAPGHGLSSLPDAAPLPHCHLLADAADGETAKLPVSCSDLGRAVPDQRPAPVADPVLAHITWNTDWLARGLRPIVLSGTPRHVDDGHWRYRPLHLQKAVLLI